jgi:hypothetical protein
MIFDLHQLFGQSADISFLESPITAMEVDEVIKALPNDKSPGPDGFNNEFFKRCWHIIKARFL